MATLDCTKFSKTALKSMLESEAFKEHHQTIAVFLAPKPKDMTPVEGKRTWKAKASTISTTVYPKGYIRVEPNQGNGCLYREACEELIAHLQAELPNLKSYSAR